MKETLVSLLAIAAIGCGGTNLSQRMGIPQRYSTNVSAGLRSSEFGDRNFNATRSVVALQTGNYSFGTIGDRIVRDNKGQIISGEDLFPYWALRDNEVIEEVSPSGKTVTFRPVDGKYRVFVESKRALGKEIDYLVTNKGFRIPNMPSMEQGVRNVGESKFEIPLINFEGEKVAYAPFSDENGQRRIAPVRGPSYGLNHRTGFVELRGKIYVEMEGATIEDRKVEAKAPESIRFISAQPEYKSVTVKPKAK